MDVWNAKVTVTLAFQKSIQTDVIILVLGKILQGLQILLPLFRRANSIVRDWRSGS